MISVSSNKVNENFYKVYCINESRFFLLFPASLIELQVRVVRDNADCSVWVSHVKF
jgi:hypothetical protein